jgi:hypothetical protein
MGEKVKKNKGTKRNEKREMRVDHSSNQTIDIFFQFSHRAEEREVELRFFVL